MSVVQNMGTSKVKKRFAHILAIKNRQRKISSELTLTKSRASRKINLVPQGHSPPMSGVVGREDMRIFPLKPDRKKRWNKAWKLSMNIAEPDISTLCIVKKS